LEHLEEVLKVLNQKPKKLTQINDISRLFDAYTADEKPCKEHKIYAPLYRQMISVHKFLSLELQCLLNSNQHSKKPRACIEALQPNRAKMLASKLDLQMTLRRLPANDSIEKVEDSRFNLFTKQLWKGIYEEVSTEQSGYTVVLVPSYFDFVKLKGFFKRKNARVAMISEYTPKKEAQRLRSLYEEKDVPVIMVTERALVFEKIRIRFARNLVLYTIPESSDIIDAVEGMMRLEAWDKILKHRLRLLKTQATAKTNTLSQDELVNECKKVV